MRTWQRVELALLAGPCVLGVLAPWESGRAGGLWIAASGWMAAQTGGLEGGSRAVTGLAVACAALGAGLRVWQARGGGKPWAAAVGSYAVVAPLCLLMPVTGAVVFLVGAALVIGVGWWGRRGMQAGGQGWMAVLARESFPVLSAGCFAVLGWQYNAQLLTRGVLVSAGVALVARAVAPRG